MKRNIVKEKSLQLSFEAINIYKLLIEKNEFILSKQFLRAATSIGANIYEADAGYSKKTLRLK
jgi:four helix bundle protein